MSANRTVETEIRDAFAPLAAVEFREVEIRVETNDSLNALALLSKGPLLVRLVRDRLQWFIEMARKGEVIEWFDHRMVLGLADVSATREPPMDVAGLTAMCVSVAEASHAWEPLFVESQYLETRRRLRVLKAASARERFGYDPGPDDAE